MHHRSPSLCILHFALCIALALATASAAAYEVRSVSIVDTHVTDGLATAFDLAFGAGQATNALYVAYGTFDGGAEPKAWQNLAKVADVLPETSSYTAAAPAGWGTSVNALRFFMADVATLPYDAALEYVATSGNNEYADTGYRPTSDTIVSIDMAYVGSGGTSANYWVPIWGYRKTSNVDAFALFINQNATKFALNFKTTDIKANSGITPGERFIYRNDNLDQYLTRVDRGESEVLISEAGATHLEFQAPGGWTIFLGGFRNGADATAADIRNLRMRVYGMKIWEGADLRRDYVPCRVGGDVGLYDNVTKTLLVASSLHAFAPGPAIVENGGFGAVAAAPATVFASGAAPVGAATRDVAMTATNRLAGAIVSLGLSFTPSYATNYLYLAYGAADGGSDPADWDHLDFVKVVEPYENGVTVPVPAGWGDAVSALRLFLGAPPAKPYDYDIEWLATTGSQWFDTGFHLCYGQTFTFLWRQFSIDHLNDRDYGWRTGSSGPLAVVGGGTHEGSAIKTYVNNAWRSLSPVFPLASLRTDTLFRDEAVVGDTFAFSQTDVATGDIWTLADTTQAPQGGTSYDSGSDIVFCANGIGTIGKKSPGKKAVYRATLATTATGEPVFDLVPVVKDGVPCFYNLVSGNLVMNAGAGDSLAGPRVAPRLGSTSFDASTETLSIANLPRVAALSVSDIPGSYSSVSVSYDVRDLGGASAVDVDLHYGPSADALSATARLASGAGLGAGSSILGDLIAGRTYYAQLVAAANGAVGEPSATFSFTVPTPESPAGGQIRAILSAEAVGGHATATFAPWNGGSIPLYVAYGAEYGGETTNGWDAVAFAGEIPASQNTATVALPAGWGSTVRFLRFFFVRELPEGMVLLDKVIASGNQYIDTGLYPDRNFTAEVRSRVTAGATDDWVPLLGERRTQGTVLFNMVLWMPKNLASQNVRPNLGNQVYDIGNQNTGRAASEFSTYSLGMRDGLVVNGATVTAPSGFVDTDNAADLSLLLFALFDRTTIDRRKFFGECAYFKAYTNDVLARHLVPCAFEGATNMFDLVSEQVFPNLGDAPLQGGAVMTVGHVCSFSDFIVAPDASAPVLGEIAASGEWRGDRVTVSGVLDGAGAGDCAIVVETSRLGDFTDAVTWPAAGTYGVGETFAVELYDADTASARYIRPGETLWYRVKATDRAGTLDATVPASVTTAAAMGIGNPAIASAGRAFTVTVPIRAVGANTNWAWVVHSVGNAFLDHATEKVAIPHDFDGASFTVPGVAATDSPDTLHWALIVSNDCSTAVWVYTTTTQTKALANNFQYTWKAGVAAGIWEDAANWDAPEGRFQWPTANSTACFSGNATASVAIASALVEVDGLYLDQPGLDVTFSGGRDRRLKVSSSLRANASGGTICVSNLSFEVTYGGFEIGEGRTMVFHDAFVEIFNNGEFGARGGPNRRFVISGGTHLRSSGRMCVGGAGSEIVIDDSYVDLYVQGNGFFMASLADGGEIILKGRNARLEAVSSGRNAGGMTNGGAIVFVIPEGGYASTPIKQVTNRHEANAWHLANPFADDGAYPSRIYPLTIRIDPDSPALRSNTSLTQPLIEWKSGINLQKVLRAPLERPRRNAFVFSGEFDDHDDWSAEWTDTENAPLALGFRRMSGGTVLYLR